MGANVGMFAIVGSAVTPTRIVAFEPEPQIAASLARTFRVNGLAARVESVAVGERPGVAKLYLSNTTDASNSLREGHRTAIGTIDVQVVTLDGYCRSTRHWPVLLKIDTETTEPEVLRGAPELLRRRPWLVCEVLPGGASGEIDAILVPLGYRFFQIGAHALPVIRQATTGFESLDAPNWLFLPGEPPAGLWDAVLRWRRRIEACRPARRIRPARPRHDGDDQE